MALMTMGTMVLAAGIGVTALAVILAVIFVAGSRKGRENLEKMMKERY